MEQTVTGRPTGLPPLLQVALLAAVLLPELGLAYLIADPAPRSMAAALGLATLPLVALAALFFRDVVLLLTTFFLPFSGVAINVGFGLEYSVLFGTLLFASAVVQRAAVPMTPGLVRRANLALGAFLLIVLASISMSVAAPVDSLMGQVPWLKSTKQFISHLAMGMMYLAFLASVRTRAMQQRCFDVLALAALLVSWYGIYQFVSLYFRLHLPWEVLPFGNISQGSAHRIGWFTSTIPRIASVAPEGPYFGMFLLVPLAYLVAMGLTRADPARWPAWRLAWYLAPMLAALALTFSRGPAIGFVLVLLLLLVRVRGWPVVRMAIVAAGVVLWLQVLLPPVAVVESRQLNKLFIQSDYSNRERLSTYVTGLNIFAGMPLLGVGIGNYGFYYLSSRPEWAVRKGEGVSIWPSIHSVPMRYLVETGVFGIVPFLAFLYFVVRAGLLALAMSRDRPLAQGLAAGSLAGLVGLLFCLAFIEVMTWAYIWFQLAMVVLCYRFAAVDRGEVPGEENG